MIGSETGNEYRQNRIVENYLKYLKLSFVSLKESVNSQEKPGFIFCM